MFGIKSVSFTDGTKRINIDYKNITEYKEPFAMILQVKGKKKELEAWECSNGKEANDIRERYKEVGYHTSYVSFYKNMDDLKEENNNSKVAFGKHRIRGKKAESNDSKELEMDGNKLAQENYLIPKELLDCTGLTYEELKFLLKKIVIQRLEKIINE